VPPINVGYQSSCEEEIHNLLSDEENQSKLLAFNSMKNGMERTFGLYSDYSRKKEVSKLFLI